MSILNGLGKIGNAIRNSGLSNLSTLGWTNKRGLNDAFFVTLYPVKPDGSSFDLPVDMAITQVVGRLISDDDTVNVDWQSKLEDSSLQSSVSEKVQGLVQSGTVEQYLGTEYLKGRTFKNLQETLQMFGGVESQEKNLLLEFVAYKNAYLEVDAPFEFLKRMASPQLSKGVIDAVVKNKGKKVAEIAKTKDSEKGIGQEPFEVAIVVGNKRLVPNNYVISSVSSDRDNIRVDRHGNTIYRQVNIVLKSRQALMRDDIKIIGL